MNIIKKLQGENLQLKNQIGELEEGILRIRAYLTSEKFHGFDNNFVNPHDIIRMIDQDIRPLFSETSQNSLNENNRCV